MDPYEIEYLSLCGEYIQGNFGSDIPDSLDTATQDLFFGCSPDKLLELQVQALKKVLNSTPEDIQCLERFAALTESTQANFRGFLVEDLYFIINTLAEVTEDLDNKVTQLIPCQVQLSKLQQISHAIVKNANFGVLAVDHSGTITMFNEAASRILSVPTQAINKDFHEVFSSLPKETMDFLCNCLLVKGSVRKEIKVKGKMKVVLVETDVLTGKTSQPEGAVLMLFDVTSEEREKKALEESIKLAAVGKMAAGVAHEIKNPLTVIKGFSQLLMAREYDPVQREKYLQLICQEADRANNFIQDFLNLGRPKKPHRKVIDARTVVEEVIVLLQSQCFLNGITITKDLECTAKIFADADQIKQVLINLAKNSMEAMEDATLPAKNLTFEISKEAADQSVVIYISDTGTGIPEDIMDKVTTSFFTTKKFGTGLGLNISDTIVSQHGGRLTFDSGPNGTTASIKIPMLIS